MDYSKYKQKMFQFIQNGICNSEDPEEIEAFYCFIEELEAIATTDSQYYELIADCYTQIKNPKKAKEAFLKFYDPTNKKHLKKLNDYDRRLHKPIPRPGKKATVLPDFPYVAPKIASKMFVMQPGKKCCICGKEAPAFYIGHAYTKTEKYINFLNKKKFCADCLKNGEAARQLDISFQIPYMNGLTRISQEKRDAILKNTPSCSADFAIYNEDVWPTCCDDFCCYHGKTDYTIFSFECIHCGKKIDMNTELEEDYEDEDFFEEDF